MGEMMPGMLLLNNLGGTTNETILVWVTVEGGWWEQRSSLSNSTCVYTKNFPQ